MRVAELFVNARPPMTLAVPQAMGLHARRSRVQIPSGGVTDEEKELRQITAEEMLVRHLIRLAEVLEATH